MFPFKRWTIATVLVVIGIVLALVLPWNIGPLGQESVGMSVTWAQGPRTWDDPELNRCINGVLDEIVAEMDQAFPERAPHWVDEWGNLRNKNIIDAQQPDDWVTRWNGKKYFRICCGWERPSVDRIQGRCGCSCAGPGGAAPPEQPPQPPQPPRVGVNNEVEPNNRFSRANLINLNSTVSGAIDPVGDVDWYQFTAPSRGEIHVLITNVAPEMEIVFQVWNANKDLLLSWQGPPRLGGDTDITFDLPEAGTYYLEVAESYNDTASAQPYSLEITFTSAADPSESNDRFADASPLTPETPIQATIFPVGDNDWYSFTVPGRSEVHVLITDVAEEMEVVFQVWNDNKDLLLSWQGPPRLGGDTDITFDLPEAGTYYLEVAESYRDARSTQPYTLEVTVIPAVDAGEDNDIFMNAEPLQLGQDVRGSILPLGDHDWYKMQISSQGELEVAITNNPPDLDMVFQVWNADKEIVCGWQGPPRLGADTQATCAVKEPGIYYLEVGDSYNDASSPEAYHLVTTLGTP